MKKIIGVSFALVVSAMSFAQSNDQVQNKNGVDIMPVSGEWGVGMNAVPMLNFIGNSFNGTGGNSIGGNKFVNYWATNTLFGKYMLSDDNAIRAQLRFGQQNLTYSRLVFDDTKNSPDSMVTDTYTTHTSNYNIGVGYEFRRGKTRLKGIYGGEVMYMFQRGTKSEYTYGNAFGIGNQAPTSSAWFGPTAPLGERLVSQKGGNFNGAGIRVFVGVEYYIAPKICFGTEFGWGIMAGKTGESVTTTEFWDNGNAITNTRSVTTASTKSLTIDTDNFGGSLYLMFYF